jgi:hypothetical protein
MRDVESAARNLNLASILCMTLGCSSKEIASQHSCMKLRTSDPTLQHGQVYYFTKGAANMADHHARSKCSGLTCSHPATLLQKQWLFLTHQ